MDWIKISEEDLGKYGNLAGDLIALENPSLIGICLGYPLDEALLNLRNPIINWLLTIRDACEKERNGLRLEQFQNTLSILQKAIRYPPLEYTNQAIRYLKGWQETAGLPSELKPPSTDVKEEMVLDIETFYARQRLLASRSKRGRKSK